MLPAPLNLFPQKDRISFSFYLSYLTAQRSKPEQWQTKKIKKISKSLKLIQLAILMVKQTIDNDFKNGYYTTTQKNQW